MIQDDEQLSASLEDYLEVIAHIVAEKQVARAKEIAAKLQVSRSSVTEAFRSLAKKGLINYAPYEVITLTDKGEEVSADIIRRHQALQDFFIKVLAVDEQTADEGACRIEHAAPRKIIDRMINFVKFVEECPRGGADWIKSFSDYCASGQTRDNCSACIATCLEKEEG
ncbi:MAG: metal-dependent transcriptional regulator [Desulfobulbaceae bacterium]|nr:MAG: metal-dependent transcriptional regulator [Desulfobulbaceae bacterium]